MTVKPIFIIGTSRSGSTMMNRILGKHAKIKDINELHFFGMMWDPSQEPQPLSHEQAIELGAKLVQKIERDVFDNKLSKQDRDLAARILQKMQTPSPAEIYLAILSDYAKKDDANFIIDQTPKNVFYIKRLLEIYPEAKAIHLIRDPRGYLLSQKNRWKKKWHGGSSVPMKNVLRTLFNYHPVSMLKLWTRSYQIGQSMMGHPRYRLIRFEDLVTEPQKTISGLCSFLKVGYDEKMLQVPQVGSSNQKFDKDKLGINSAVAETWKAGLPKKEIFLCEYLLESQMKKMGYETTGTKLPVSVLSVLFSFPVHVAGAVIFNPKVLINTLKNLKP